MKVITEDIESSLEKISKDLYKLGKLLQMNDLINRRYPDISWNLRNTSEVIDRCIEDDKDHSINRND